MKAHLQVGKPTETGSLHATESEKCERWVMPQDFRLVQRIEFDFDVKRRVGQAQCDQAEGDLSNRF